MNSELIDLGDEASLADEDSWKRTEAPKTEPAKDAVVKPGQNSSRPSRKFVRVYDYSPLNE
jgi:hypothetical protein